MAAEAAGARGARGALAAAAAIRLTLASTPVPPLGGRHGNTVRARTDQEHGGCWRWPWSARTAAAEPSRAQAPRAEAVAAISAGLGQSVRLGAGRPGSGSVAAEAAGARGDSVVAAAIRATVAHSGAAAWWSSRQHSARVGRSGAWRLLEMAVVGLSLGDRRVRVRTRRVLGVGVGACRLFGEVAWLVGAPAVSGMTVPGCQRFCGLSGCVDQRESDSARGGAIRSGSSFG
ncbi:hypothetical protein GCM10010483_00360 [Actinokineospora diospyrosa]